MFEGIDAHCGYNFPWNPCRILPLSNESHNFHHSHNSGVYSNFFIFWDIICGTDKDYNEYLD